MQMALRNGVKSVSNYTMSVQEICEGGLNVFSDFTYELYDNGKKSYLEERFLHYYWFREIAHETVSIWRYHLRYRWYRLIEHYNKLWVENNKLIDPFKNMVMEVNGRLIVKDTPMSEYDIEDKYATGIQSTNSSTSGQTMPSIELLTLYNKKLVDITQKFMEEFNDLFMGLY